MNTTLARSKSDPFTRALAAALLALVALGALASPTVRAADNGFDAAAYRQWVEMRVGSGEPVYWYCVGTVFSYPDGKPLMKMEGVDTARLDRSESTPTVAHQLSRKTFVYRDLQSGAILREWQGKPLPPIAYPYQYITYAHEGSSVVSWVEQGKAPRVQRIGPGTDTVARRIGDSMMFSAPVFLDFPTANGGRYEAFENYDFFVAPASAGLKFPYQISWVRYGDLAGGAQKTIMHLVAWRVDRYSDLPASIREYLESEAPMWKAPPRDLAEIRALQR
jgi:hypothetical protein